MAINQKYVQAQTFTLAGAGVNAGDNSMTLNSFNGINGVPLTMSNFGIQGFGTNEPAGANEEQISFTGVVANVDGTTTLTDIHTVLDIFPYTQTANFALPHPGATSFVISNTAGFYGTFANKGNDETITGAWTFTLGTRPVLTADADTANNAALVTYGQLARTAIAGGTNATTSLQGFVQLATQAQYDAKTATGSTGAALVAPPNLNRATKYNDYVVDNGSANTYVITPSPAISAYVAGQQFTFKVSNTNTTASTLNVNGLGAITIKNNISVALIGGELTANSIVSVIYDGTNFQINTSTNPSSLSLFSDGVTTKNAADNNAGTPSIQTIAHGLAQIPKKVTLTFTTGKLGCISRSVYNNIVQSSQSVYTDTTGTVSVNTLSINSGVTGIGADNGIITTDATNIYIAWSTVNNNLSGIYNLVWEAEV